MNEDGEISRKVEADVEAKLHEIWLEFEKLDKQTQKTRKKIEKLQRGIDPIEVEKMKILERMVRIKEGSELAKKQIKKTEDIVKPY